jgi:hypothetical protein
MALTPHQQMKKSIQAIILTTPNIISDTKTMWDTLPDLDKARLEATYNKSLSQISDKIASATKLSLTSVDILQMPIASMLEQATTMKTLLVSLSSGNLLHMVTFNATSIIKRYPSHKNLTSEISQLLTTQLKSPTYISSTNLTPIQLTSPVEILREIITDFNQLLRSAPTKIQAFILATTEDPNVPNQNITTITESLKQIYVVSNTIGIPNTEIKISMIGAINKMFQRCSGTVLNQYNVYQNQCTSRDEDPYLHIMELAAAIKAKPPAASMVAQEPPQNNFPIIDPLTDPTNIIAANNFIAHQHHQNPYQQHHQNPNSQQSNFLHSNFQYPNNNNQHQPEYRGNNFKNNYSQNQQRQYASHPYINNNNNNSRPCHAFQNGNCRFGSNCRFTHDNQQDSNQRNDHSGNRNRQQTQNHSNAGRRVKFSKTDVNK